MKEALMTLDEMFAALDAKQRQLEERKRRSCTGP